MSFLVLSTSIFLLIERWLSAMDYYQLLIHMEEGHSQFPFFDLGHDSHSVTYHPSFIYQNPCPAIYYLRCDHLKNGKTMFGFPRIKNVSKEYTWKKQGFTTVVPKSNPCIRYITANCYLCGKGKNKVEFYILRKYRTTFMLPFLGGNQYYECMQ